MQVGHVRKLRRRKLELYASLLPHGVFPPAMFAFVGDTDYAAALLEIARIAPPGYGLAVGRHRRLSDLGVLGHVSRSCATMREVLELWMIYADSAGEPVTYDVSLGDDRQALAWSIAIRPFKTLPPQVRDLLAVELCATFFVFARELTGRDFIDFDVEIGVPKVVGVDYQACFPGKLSFTLGATRLIGPATALDLPVLQHDDDSLEELIDRMGGDPADLDGVGATTLQLYDFFVRRRTASPSLHDAAVALHTSERTLIRRLAAEQTSYGAALDEFRRRYAMTLAQYGGLKAKQIAHLVGFKSENSLRKAFKKWTGQPIGTWTVPPTASE